MKQRATIKGLGARLQADSPVGTDEHPIDVLSGDSGRLPMNVPMEAVSTNPGQPRKHFDEQALNELAQSIRTQGLLQPVIVKRTAADRFLLVAGERRFRACRSLGWQKIPAILTQGDELEIAIIENLQREDLTAIEEAEGLQSLSDRFSYTQEQLARVVGRSRSAVAETLALMSLPETIKAECRTSDIGTKHQLLQVVREKNEGKRKILWDAIKSGTFTVREARKSRQVVPGRDRPKPFSKSFAVEASRATVTVRFKKTAASDQEIADALRAALEEQERIARN